MLIKDLSKFIKNVRGAIHVGGHDGEERQWYKDYGFAPVIWFEPNHNLFKRLQTNISSFENQIAYNYGVHDTLKKGILHISSNDGQSSSLLDLKLHKDFHPTVKYIGDQEVQLIRMDEFLNEHGFCICDFNFLNIDVQGIELNVIKSFGDKISQLDYIYTEINIAELYAGCTQLKDLDLYLKKYGFVRVIHYLTKNRWGDALYIKKN